MMAMQLKSLSNHTVSPCAIFHCNLVQPSLHKRTKMGTPPLRTGLFLFVLVLLVQNAGGYFYPSHFRFRFSTGDEIYAKVSSLTSVESTLPYSYYTLPYCKPQRGIKRSSQNIGESLVGEQVLNSPYHFRMNVNESLYLCTTHPLNKNEEKLLKERVRNLYQVNMILDNIPVMRYVKNHGMSFQWTGFPVGYTPFNSYEDYVINHLKFRILVHEGNETIDAVEGGMGKTSEAHSTFYIVGFEVVPCSIRHDPAKMRKLHMTDRIAPVDCPTDLENSQIIREGESVSFTYEVEFVKSNIKWSSRWDVYLKMEGVQAHWFSILNSAITIVFLTGIMLAIFLRTIRKYLSKYTELDKESQSQFNEKLSGWKLLAGDVFREPRNSRVLCVLVGNGVQIAGMAVLTTILAALGFMSPDSRGMLLTGMIFLFNIMGIVAGYVSVRLWITIKGNSEGWLSLSWRTSLIFPGTVCIIHTVLNIIFWHNDSTSALSLTVYFILACMWFFILVPFTLLGGFIVKSTEQIQNPVYVNPISSEIRPRKYPSWLLVLGAGSLPFGTLFIELFFILSSFWLGRFYYVFGFLLIVLVLLIVVSAQASIIITYINLRAGDWRWWWKAFYASGSTALYVFLYCVHYLVFDLQSLSGPTSIAIYLGYTLIATISIMLALGAIGFLASFYFVHLLFSAINSE